MEPPAAGRVGKKSLIDDGGRVRERISILAGLSLSRSLSSEIVICREITLFASRAHVALYTPKGGMRERAVVSAFRSHFFAGSLHFPNQMDYCESHK